MGERQAQEFWDEMWGWEKYERFPSESVDDPHLVVQLGSQIDNIRAGGGEPAPELFARYDQCVGRVLDRLTNRLPRRGENADLEEFGAWLRFGLDPAVRGHDAAVTPIIDAGSLVVFRFFVRHAVEYCSRHGLDLLRDMWSSIGEVARNIDEEREGPPGESRFGRVEV